MSEEREGFQQDTTGSEGLEGAEKERRARAVGWVPESEFRGDKSKWVDADTFLDRADHVMPILRKNNSQLQSRLAEQEAELRRLRAREEENARILNTLKEAQDDSTVKALEARAETIRADLAAALKEGDHERAVALQEELVDVKADLKVRSAEDTDDEEGHSPQPVRPQVTAEQKAEFEQWKSENPWYEDPAMVAVANVYATQVIREAMANGETPPKGRALLDEVTKRVDNRFNVSGTPSGDRVAGANGRRGSKSGGGSRFSDLPADAQAACRSQAKRYVGEGKRFKTAAEWESRFAQLYFQQTGGSK